jgi:hypothetical protein
MTSALAQGIRNHTRVRLARVGMAVCAAGLLVLATASIAGAASFSSSPITMGAGAATPSPSTIQVSGLGPTAEDVNVSFLNFSHNSPSDVDALLQGPNGQSVLLMSDAPNVAGVCYADVAGLTLNFDDDASGPIPAGSLLASGTYKPTNYNDVPGSCLPGTDNTPPATATALSAFNGGNPNGAWSLFVNGDDAAGTGTIAGGWKLDIAPTNDITLGKVIKKKKKGIALVKVDVPGPGTLALTGTGIKPQRSAGGATASKAVTAAGRVTLKVKAKGAKKAKLQDNGKVKVTAKIAFTPTGGTADTETKKIKLIDN